MDHQKNITSHQQANQDQAARNRMLSELEEKTAYWKQKAKSR